MARPPTLPVPAAVSAGAWSLVAARSYGTAVYRVQGRDRAWYVKTAPALGSGDLRFNARDEALRLAWLRDRGFPAPEVVDVGASDDAMWLVTLAIDGRLASAPWRPEDRPLVLDAVADLARALHAVPVEECPFDLGLAVSLRWARTATRDGKVDVDDLEDEHHGWSADRLLAALEALAPPAEEDLVACHGDLAFDNVLIDPSTLALCGILDAGRLGRADRWRDLMTVMRSLDEQRAQWGHAEPPAQRFLRRYGLDGIDEDRLAYYRLLDEFF
jgi:aminoglycoside phosphotransferase